jgi:hypothetical protein
MSIAASWVESERLSRGLAAVDSLIHRRTAKAKTSAPFGDGKPLTVVSHNNVRSLVPGLLCASSPTAVLRRVWAVVVDAIKRVLRRGPPAHVSQKRLVRPSPSLAYRYAAAAVVRPAWQASVGAPGLHAGPSPMLCRRLRFAVRRLGRTNLRGLHAAARWQRTFAHPVTQMCEHLDSLCPTDAATASGWVTFHPMAQAILEHGPVTECLFEHDAH